MGRVCIDYNVAYSPYKPEGWGYYDVVGKVCMDYAAGLLAICIVMRNMPLTAVSDGWGHRLIDVTLNSGSASLIPGSFNGLGMRLW